MTSYKSLLTKDDKLFLDHAKKALGTYVFNDVMQEAKEVFESIKRPSEAKREANLIILSALKEIGEEHWRPSKDNEPKAERIQVKPAALPERKAKKKWEGKSILQMHDERRGK